MTSAATIIVAGRATVDLIMEIDQFSARGEKMRAHDSRFVVGGPGANASIAIARFGGRPFLAAYLGDDMMGRFIHQSLSDEMVDMSLSPLTPQARSSVSAAFVNHQGERQTFNYAGQGFSLMSKSTRPTSTPCAVLADNRHPELTSWAIELGKEQHVPIIIDAEAPFSADHAIGATHLAFSKQGLDSFTPSRSIEEGLCHAREATGCWVCVTDGENGVWHLHGSEVVNVPAFAVEAVDTIGAGDVWHGIFALCLGEGMDETSAITTANAAAAMKCLQFGGISASPDRQSCTAFMEEY
ncbi:carbohydrate kinase family protein [Alphaproteobacteria bacterium LSUCC0719]